MQFTVIQRVNNKEHQSPCICFKHELSVFFGVPAHPGSLLHPFPPSFYCSFSVTGACFPFLCGGSWLGCQDLSTMGAVSIKELAANSGSSWLSQAPNLHLAMQLLTRKWPNAMTIKRQKQKTFPYPLLWELWDRWSSSYFRAKSGSIELGSDGDVTVLTGSLRFALCYEIVHFTITNSVNEVWALFQENQQIIHWLQWQYFH